ncbi:MAG: hypothetical protein LBV61_09075, partial [Burkholderiaceae bacterium]|nr:hypothetical protein [Burkholderiaceae bacterium]
MGRNRDKWVANGAPHGLMPMQATWPPNRPPNRPISVQPEGQMSFRAVCGVATLAHSAGYGLRAAPCIPSRKGICV